MGLWRYNVKLPSPAASLRISYFQRRKVNSISFVHKVVSCGNNISALCITSGTQLPVGNVSANFRGLVQNRALKNEREICPTHSKE
jgi:hypothetical protein